MKKNNILGCDLFSGAGGMSLGAEMASINISLAVEIDKHAVLTFKANHPDTKVLETDIRKINPLEYFQSNPFIVFGGPPCQGFSLSNTNTRNSDNKNNSLFEEFLRFIELLEPEWCVFENVEGFRSFKKGLVVSTLKERLEKLGYSINYNVLLASDFGVPQDRRRFFMVGNRKGKKYLFPEGNHPKVSVQDAISDLPSLKNGDHFDMLSYKTAADNAFAQKIRSYSKKSKQNYVSRNDDYVLERYSYIKPGQNWQAIPDNLMQNYTNKLNCHSGIYKRLDPKKPSVVISNYRKNMLIHPFEDRGLSVREAARLQSFPDNFLFKGSLMYIQQQIGNAVPPLLANAIFQRILDT